MAFGVPLEITWAFIDFYTYPMDNADLEYTARCWLGGGWLYDPLNDANDGFFAYPYDRTKIGGNYEEDTSGSFSISDSTCDNMSLDYALTEF